MNTGGDKIVVFRPSMDVDPEAASRLAPELVPALLAGRCERIQNDIDALAWELSANPAAMPPNALLDILELAHGAARLAAGVRVPPTTTQPIKVQKIS